MKEADAQLEAAVRTLRSYGARRVLLFGSYLYTPEAAGDIDLAVQGIPLRRLLDADLALYKLLRRSFDLVSREEDPAFFDLIQAEARVLYEEG